jgi:hypothetical protein
MKVKCEVKAQLRSFLTSVLDGVSGQLHYLAALATDKATILPVIQEDGWASSSEERKTLATKSNPDFSVFHPQRN